MSKSFKEFAFEPVVKLVNQWPWLASKVNQFAINGTVNVCRHRPHPWSTAHDYVSWTSLTDQRWSARHLPAVDRTGLPPSDSLVDLFRRPSGSQKLCDKSSCLFPAFAQYLTDGFIRTKMPKTGESEEVRKQNTSNHQIDLCTLYGRTSEQTDALRQKSETLGRKGRLKSQSIGQEEYAPFLFADDGTIKLEFARLDAPLGVDEKTVPEIRNRIFAFGGDRANASPQVAMLNTLFLREHNRLAGEMERAEPAWDDERVFQTARNSVIVLFIKIVVEEYINHISPSPFRFIAYPQVAFDAPWNKPNWITTEFSLLYRWHSLVPDNLSWNGHSFPLGALLMNNGPLLKSGLQQAFVDMSAQKAAKLGAFNTADVLLGLEKRAIDQDRLCRLDSYGAYREYVGLPKPTDFDEVSTDQAVVDFLRKAYRSPEDIDFYVGLFAEDATKNSPLPPLILRMVAVDAFSQALTNPLLSKAVFNPATFSDVGWTAIDETHRLKDLVARNVPDANGTAYVGMTQPEWRFTWT